MINLLKDEDIADPILQDVFLRIWERRREQIDIAQPFEVYLYKIAENFVYDHFRKLSRDLRMQARLRHLVKTTKSVREYVVVAGGASLAIMILFSRF
ncbi:RNA polymerase sigma factor [Mucilaginibacter kameinonensis]|uniref:RNA polymerase sigma factor n=1 Tax=Mucilaginibacter kameinonensis TaxID=452286 RepID=UPI0013CE9DA6|nr:sigma factor [Mucilaginibacter kameinonensis]